jgi:hypothetical protein
VSLEQKESVSRIKGIEENPHSLNLRNRVKVVKIQKPKHRTYLIGL